MFQTTRRVAVMALACTASLGFAQANKGDIRIAHIYSKTGPLEAYAKQTHIGLMLGLEYATGGTMTVNGRKLVVHRDATSQTKPDMSARAQLAAAFGDDKADIAIGPTSSGTSRWRCFRWPRSTSKILLVEPAVADSITGDKWNKYIFRTGRSSAPRTRPSNAARARTRRATQIATLAQRLRVRPRRGEGVQGGARQAPARRWSTRSSCTAGDHRLHRAGLLRIVQRSSRTSPGKKYDLGRLVWARPEPGEQACNDMKPDKRFGIEIATGGNILPAMAAFKSLPGHGGRHCTTTTTSRRTR